MKSAASNIEHQRHQSTCRMLLYVHRKRTAVWIHYTLLELQLLNLIGHINSTPLFCANRFWHAWVQIIHFQSCIEISSCVWYQMKEEKMPLIIKHIVWLNLAWQWRYLTDKTGFLFIGTHCIYHVMDWLGHVGRWGFSLCRGESPGLCTLVIITEQTHTMLFCWKANF